jgi:hypothetical protein
VAAGAGHHRKVGAVHPAPCARHDLARGRRAHGRLEGGLRDQCQVPQVRRPGHQQRRAGGYRWSKIVWTPALTRQWAGASWPEQDSWVIWARETCCNYTPRDWWYQEQCVAGPYGFVPPEPFAIGGPVWSGSFCYNPAPPGYTDAFVYYASAPENALGAPAPIAPYTNQPYTYSTPAPTAPPQTTVEQSIDNELAKPENSLLRQWLNYQLGSPGEEDPLGIGPPNAGIEFPQFDKKWDEHWQEFPEYSDPWEYWQGAVDIIERGDRSPTGGEGVQKCETTDGGFIYWDIQKATFVVVRDGKIITYFKPDDADAYWLEQCPSG